MATQTILVAEDDRAIRELLTHHLEREGFAVVGVADGHAALRHARSAADLLVLDVGLPGVDGYDVVRTLRREERNLPIVVLTARSDEIDRVLGFELGADDYISKPTFATKMRPHSPCARSFPISQLRKSTITFRSRFRTDARTQARKLKAEVLQRPNPSRKEPLAVASGSLFYCAIGNYNPDSE